MPRIKLNTFVLLILLFTTSSMSANQINDMVNDAIGDYLNDMGLDSLVNVDCQFFNGDPNEFKFNILGCEIDLSLNQCYNDSVDSFKDSFEFKTKRFDKNELCKSFLKKEKEMLSKYNNPFDISNYLKVEKLPKTIEGAEEKVFKEKKLLTSLGYVAPKNIMSSKTQFTKEVEALCKGSSNKEQCILKNSLKMARKQVLEYDQKKNEVFSAFERDKFLATTPNDYLFEPTKEKLEQMPYNKRNDFIKKSNKTLSMETLNSIYSNSNQDNLSLVYEEYGDVLARSIYIEDVGSLKNKADESIAEWSLP